MKKFKKYILITIASLLLCTSTAFTLSYEEAYLTATLFGEAGGEGVTGMQTVASVIMNRRNYYQAHAKGGQTVKLSDVCLARYQFSFWNDKRNWTVQNIESWASKLNSANARAWNKCLEIARQAIAGSLKDVTNGATFYYATWMDKKGKAPAWARGRNYKVVGNHKIVYGVGLSALKTWHSGTSLAGGGGGSSWNGTLSGGGTGGSSNYDLANDPENEYVLPPECKGAAEKNGQIVNNEIMKHRLFAEDILIDLKDMMALIYQSLSVLFARGHALMCFSTKVSFICLDGGAGFSAAIKSLVSCTVVVPLLNYFISGLLIYLTGFFMCMSIGMYFIDISFKLGFATLLLPLSISLWPFPPTQSKLSENIAIVIYNAMLFAFVSIGTAYAVKLVDASLGMVKDAEFWMIMGATDNGLGNGLANTTATWQTLNSGDYADSMEKFSESYDLSSVNILIILFALIFGFKILSSSIQNYLSTFFGDGALGSADTAMHHLGTQAVGKIKQSIVNPTARVARDIALNQGGKGIEKLGNKLANKKFGGAAAPAQGGTNPQPSPSGGANPSPASNADDAADNNDTPDNTNDTPDTPINNDSDNSGQPTADSSETPQTTDSGSPQTTDNGATSSENSNTRGAQSENTQSAELPQTKWQQFKNYSRPTGHSLTIGNAFKAVHHPQQAYRTIKQLARQGSQDWKNAETLKDKGKLVLKKSGQVVIRSVRGTATETANAGMGIAGGFLQSLGKSMQKKPQQYYRQRQKQKNNRSSDDSEYQRQLDAEYQSEQERNNSSN